MIFDWYKLFNLAEFMATNLTSRSMEVYLEGRGLVDILITRGHEVSILVDGVFLTLNLNAVNPFAFEQRAVYEDADGVVWVGFQVPDET